MLANMDDYDVTVATINQYINHEVANKAARPIQISKDLGIADAVATVHFLQPGAPAINIRRTKTQSVLASQTVGSWNPHTNVR